MYSFQAFKTWVEAKAERRNCLQNSLADWEKTDFSALAENTKTRDYLQPHLGMLKSWANQVDKEQLEIELQILREQSQKLHAINLVSESEKKALMDKVSRVKAKLVGWNQKLSQLLK